MSKEKFVSFLQSIESPIPNKCTNDELDEFAEKVKEIGSQIVVLKAKVKAHNKEVSNLYKTLKEILMVSTEVFFDRVKPSVEAIVKYSLNEDSRLPDEQDLDNIEAIEDLLSH